MTSPPISRLRSAVVVFVLFCLVAAGCSSEPGIVAGEEATMPTVTGTTTAPTAESDSTTDESNESSAASTAPAAESSSTTEADQDGGSPDSTEPPVTIEPPVATAAPVPVPDAGCGGAGVDEAGGFTRVGVLVPDFEALGSTGFVPRVTPAEYQNRYWATFLAANKRAESAFAGSPGSLPCGPIELEVVAYDPLDPSSQRDACIELTDDDGVVVVLAEIDDHRGEALDCLLNEADIPVIVAGGVSSADLERHDGQLISMRPPVDLLGSAAAAAYGDLGLLDGVTVAVLAGDQPGSIAAADAVVSTITEQGLPEPLVITLPTEAGITQAWSEVPAAAEAMIDAGTTVVISVFDAVINNALWDEMVDREASWEWLLVDASGIGEHDKVSRLPDQFAGLVLTSQQSQKEADRSSPTSLQCIADYDALLVDLGVDVGSDAPAANEPPVTAAPDTTVPPATVAPDSAPSTFLLPGDDEESEEDGGDGIETAARELLGEDRPPGPACAIATVALQAIASSGDQLTTQTLQAALAGLGQIDTFIEGAGSLSASKHYVSDFVQVLRFERYLRPISEELAAPCGSPENCWRTLDLEGAVVRPVVPS